MTHSNQDSTYRHYNTRISYRSHVLLPMKKRHKRSKTKTHGKRNTHDFVTSNPLLRPVHPASVASAWCCTTAMIDNRAARTDGVYGAHRFVAVDVEQGKGKTQKEKKCIHEKKKNNNHC